MNSLQRILASLLNDEAGEKFKAYVYGYAMREPITDQLVADAYLGFIDRPFN